MMSGPLASARSSCSSESTSISIVVPAGRIGPRRRDRRGDRIGPGRPGGCLEPGEVIVLDQNRIEQAEAVVAPSAAPDRVLFQGAPAGSGLARVVNRGAGAGDRRDEPRRQGRDPAQPLEKVEGGPLHRQQANASARARARSGCPARGDRRRPEAAPSGRKSSNSATTRSTAGMPASTPGDRATNRAAPRAWLGIVAVEVMSPTWPRSSASACAIKTSTLRRSRSANR